jgi:hypothetical protein
VDGSGETAMKLFRSTAEMVYKETPELEKIMPKKSSKILNSTMHKSTKENKAEEPAIFTGNWYSLNIYSLNFVIFYL